MKSVLLVLLGVGLAGGGYSLYRWMISPSPGDGYEPSASEVPLTVDFEVAAEKRVLADSYRKELTSIENELLQLSQEEARQR